MKKKKKKDSPFFSHSLLPDFILVLMYSRTIMRPLLTAKTLRKVILFIKREKRLSRTRREEPKKQMLLVQTRCRGKFSCQLNKELLMKSNSLAFCRPPARSSRGTGTDATRLALDTTRGETMVCLKQFRWKYLGDRML